MNTITNTIKMGFALFAMFFGAGNLVFPPLLGVNTGIYWSFASIGFIITGIGFPFLGILAYIQCKELRFFASKVSPFFNKIFCSILILTLAISILPRTGSITYEMGILPLIANPSNIIVTLSSLGFFSLVFLLSIKEHSIISIIGKYLTPILLVTLLCVFIKGFSTLSGEAINPLQIDNAFHYGFIMGYQTMDALVSIFLGSMIIRNLKEDHITDTKTQKKYLLNASFIAFALLATTYTILIYFGSLLSSNNEFSSTTDIILYIVQQTLGNSGQFIFSICIIFACLTSAVAMAGLTADWFSKISKFSYRSILIIIVVASVFPTINGMDNNIAFSTPILTFLYPIMMVLIILNIFNMSSLYFKLVTYTTMSISLLELLVTYYPKSIFYDILKYIPLYTEGFSWVFPMLISMLVVKVMLLRKNPIISKKI